MSNASWSDSDLRTSVDEVMTRAVVMPYGHRLQCPTRKIARSNPAGSSRPGDTFCQRFDVRVRVRVRSHVADAVGYLSAIAGQDGAFCFPDRT